MIVGLTGGIGSGKSTVCEIFKYLGVPIISADQISRHIVDTDKEILQSIITKFGQEFLTADHKLDRAKLRQQIFTNPDHKLWLEKMLHPLIRQEILRQAHHITYPYCVAEIPLLLEAGMQDIVDRILTLDCSVELQLQRAMQRDQFTAKEIRAIIATQIPRQERLERSHDVVENSTDMATLTKRIEQLHALYLDLAS